MSSTRNTELPSFWGSAIHLRPGFSTRVTMMSLAMFRVYTLGSMAGVNTHSMSAGRSPAERRGRRESSF